MVVVLFLPAVLFLAPLCLLCSKKKTPPSGTSQKNEQDVKTRLDKLEKGFKRYICLKRDCCSGCNDYATRIEKLWRTKPTSISRETRRRLNKKHAEIGGRFELLAGRWQQREGGEKMMQLEVTQKSSKGRIIRGEEKKKYGGSREKSIEDFGHPQPAEVNGEAKEHGYENLVELPAILTQETQDSEG